MVFDKQNMAKEFIKVIEDGIEKSKTLATKAGEKPTFATERKEIAYDADAEVKTAQESAEDDLGAIKAEIVTLCKELGGTSNEKLMTTLKEYVPSGNPNAIRSVDKAKELLAKLNEMNNANA